MTTAKLSFGTFEGKPGAIRSCDIFFGGELVGEISVEWTDATPGMMSHKYVVGGYWVELYDIEGYDKCFDVGQADAKVTLKTAKEYVRSCYLTPGS